MARASSAVHITTIQHGMVVDETEYAGSHSANMRLILGVLESALLKAEDVSVIQDGIEVRSDDTTRVYKLLYP